MMTVMGKAFKVKSMKGNRARIKDNADSKSSDAKGMRMICAYSFKI